MDNKNNLSLAYTQAQLTATFIMAGIGGQPAPSLQELFPEIYGGSTQVSESKRNDAWMLYKEQFIDYAEKHNERRRLKGVVNE